MRKRFLSLLVAAAAALLTVTSASAQFPGLRTADEVLRDAAEYRAQLVADRPMVGPGGDIILGIRCATHGLTPAERAAADARGAMFADAAEPTVEELLAEPRRARNRVNTYVHVVHDGVRGNVSDADIAAQIKVLNRAFRSRGFVFRLKGTTRTRKRTWFNKCFRRGAHRRMTKRLAVNPKKNLNIYICNPGNGILGYTFTLGSAVTGTKQDSVMLLYSSLPNGTAAPYNEGDTATHEVGHWLGLNHTFAGRCGARGDQVADTPAEREPAYGCPIGRDTCPAKEGDDPIFNFMDYSDDSCMNTFSKGQKRRMKQQAAAFRPKI